MRIEGFGLGVKQEFEALWRVAEPPIGTALIVNIYSGIRAGHGAQAQIDSQLSIIGLDFTEKLIGLLQSIGHREIHRKRLAIKPLAQRKIEGVSVKVVPLGQIPEYFVLAWAHGADIEGKRLLQREGLLNI